MFSVECLGRLSDRHSMRFDVILEYMNIVFGIHCPSKRVGGLYLK